MPDLAQLSLVPFGTDDTTGADEDTAKEFGYGEPVQIVARERSGALHRFVLHTAAANIFGHDWRADRAHGMLLAADTFGSIPNHVAVIDVGAVDAGGSLRSLADCTEFYLLTEYAPGTLYADDLRRIAHQRQLQPGDVERCRRLAEYLASLHAHDIAVPHLYRRAIRDLVGHGEGIFGIIDGYPDDVPGAPAERLRAIENQCWAWRWRLRTREHRLARTHGDFHPFNILFSDDDELALLDASRGCQGDPADDATCLAINYPFFALGASEDVQGAWHGGLRALWYEFWRHYLACSDDPAVLEVAAPYFAWRALVLCNPRWYPALPEVRRSALLGMVEQLLGAERLAPGDAEVLFS